MPHSEQLTSIANPSIWAKFGLSGLVILALFLLLALVLYYAMKTIKESNKEHSEERKDWYESNRSSSEKLTVAIDKLTQSIWEANNRK